MKWAELAKSISRALRPSPRQTIGDGYINMLGNYGQTGSNIASGGAYINNYVTREPQILRTMYRTSFIVRRVCDSRAEDMTKAGARIDAEVDPAIINQVQAELRRLKMWQQVADAVRWSSLFGTSFLMPVIDGQDSEKPFKPESIGKGQLTGFMVFDRWQLVPSWQDGRVLTLGRDNGYPLMYMTISNGMGIPQIKIHHSRIFRIDATPLPWWDRYAENFFSASVVEAILDRVKAFDQASAAAVSLIEAARNDVVYTDTLPEVAGENAGLFERLQAKIREMMRFRSNNGITFLAKDEKLERFSTALTGVSDIIDRMGQQVAGATEIPLCRLLGVSTGGLNGGDNDLLDAYYEDIGRRQESQLLDIVEIFTYMAFLNTGNPIEREAISIKFNPLKSLSFEKRATVAQTNTTTIISAYDAGIITPACAAKELRQLTEYTGVFSNITDEDIKDLEDAPPRAELPNPDDEQSEQPRRPDLKIVA